MKVIVSEENLVHNINYMKEKYKRQLITVLKANAFGHGIEEVADILYRNNQKEFAVARFIEAEQIKNSLNQDDVEILIFERIEEENLTKVLTDKEYIVTANTLEDLINYINKGLNPYQIQIKIDFGFGRNGIGEAEVEELKNYIEENKFNFKFKGIYSHLYATNYEEGKELINKFIEIVKYLGRDKFQKVHMQNSVGMLEYGEIDFFTHMRPGLYIYGLQEVGFYHENLKQVFSFKGKIDSVKNIENSKYIAYSTKENLNLKNCKNVAKIKVGYGDGYLKSNEGSSCLINNKEYKITSITMDNTFIEVDSKVKEGDEVELYYDVDLISEYLGFHICEILPMLSTRIKRKIG